jgi:hypothetical protein
MSYFAVTYDFSAEGIAAAVKHAIADGTLKGTLTAWDVIKFAVDETGLAITVSAANDALRSAGLNGTRCKGVWYWGGDRHLARQWPEATFNECLSIIKAVGLGDQTTSLAVHAALMRRGLVTSQHVAAMALRQSGYSESGQIVIGAMTLKRFVKRVTAAAA